MPTSSQARIENSQEQSSAYHLSGSVHFCFLTVYERRFVGLLYAV